MKFFHLADLHLGIRVNEFSMIDDQRHILGEILRLAETHKPQAVLIAGDVYDKATPTTEAVKLLGDFLVGLSRLNIAVYMIPGNHDNAERLAFAAPLLENSGLYIAQAYNGEIAHFSATDDFGNLNFWLLPYIKPAAVRQFFPENTIKSYNDAVAAVLQNAYNKIDRSQRNILLAHQFITGATTSQSEEIYIGGLENVNAELFAAFDYVALGHLHRPQAILRDSLRYSGTPLKYSLSEVSHEKTVTVVDILQKGDLKIAELPLNPVKNMQEIKGKFAEISQNATNDYVYITLTDELEEPHAISRLQRIFPNLMKLQYENSRTKAEFSPKAAVNTKLPLDLLQELYTAQNGSSMTAEQADYSADLLQKIKEDLI
ncbi:MAG: exonuclease SbcCD subunit D [Defluviitaleaceae bacterium]|nr:exonuclease SbcCD subunit D [Defluviitaleaceae bacterium]